MKLSNLKINLERDTFRPKTSADYVSCVLAARKNEPINIIELTNLIMKLGWKSNAIHPQNTVQLTVSGRFSEVCKNIFVCLPNKHYKLSDSFYEKYGESLAKIININNTIQSEPQSKQSDFNNVVKNTQKAIQQTATQPMFQKIEQISLQKNAISLTQQKTSSPPIQAVEEAEEAVVKAIAFNKNNTPNWNKLAEPDAIDKLNRLGVPKEIIGFVYSAMRTETTSFFCSSKNQEKLSNTFITFLVSLNDTRIINWLFTHKALPINNVQNKYEQALTHLIEDAKRAMVEHQTKQQKIAAFKLFNEMLKLNEDFKKLREGEEVRLVLMGDEKMIPFGRAIFRNGEIFLKHE